MAYLVSDRLRRQRFGLRQGGQAGRAGRRSPNTNVEGGGPPAAVMLQIKTLRERIAAHPDDDVAMTQLGDMELAVGRYAQAIPLYTPRSRSIRTTSRRRRASNKPRTDCARRVNEALHFRRHGRHGRRLLLEAVRPKRRARISGVSPVHDAGSPRRHRRRAGAGARGDGQRLALGYAQPALRRTSRRRRSSRDLRDAQAALDGARVSTRVSMPRSLPGITRARAKPRRSRTPTARTSIACRVNGTPCSEALLYAAFAGSYGVPVVLVTGDDAIVRETLASLPWAVGVAVKGAIGYTAVDSLTPEAAARPSARARAKRSAASRTRQAVYLRAAVRTLIETVNVENADYMELMPQFERTGGRSVRFSRTTIRRSAAPSSCAPHLRRDCERRSHDGAQ